MSDEWKKHTKVVQAHGDSAWYVQYESPGIKSPRLRLTIRGTWHPDDMDIYWRTKGEAYHAMETAKPPMTERDRIATLESTCRMASSILFSQYNKLTLKQVQELPWLSAAICNVAQDLAAAVSAEEEGTA